MEINLPSVVPGLANADAFRTRDLDAARRHIGDMFAPHDLSIRGRNQHLDVCIAQARIDCISLVYHRHGATVRVRPDKLKHFYLLQVPIRGTAEVTIDNQLIHCDPQLAVMISPTLGVDMQFEADCEQLIVRIERANLEHRLEQELARPLGRPLEFSPAVGLSTVNSRQLLDMLGLMTTSLTNPAGIASTAIGRRQMTSLFLSGLLYCLDHNYREELSGLDGAQSPAYIRKARRFMAENLKEAITPEDVAAAVGVSARALFAGFKTALGTTPMRYLKDLRLTAVHDRLSQLEPGEQTVTAVAMDYGFDHMGWFCADYKEKFGELPRETLLRSVT